MFQHLDQLVGVDTPVTDANVEQVIAEVRDVNENVASYLRAASRMTWVASMIEGGVKSNSVAEKCLITCDVRTLPQQGPAYVQRELEKLLADLSGVKVEVIETAVSNASTFDHEFADRVMSATRAAIGSPDITFVPGLTVGFTDSRFVRPLGNIAYGFMPAHPEADPSKSGAHNINESIDLDTIHSITRYLVALAWETLGAKAVP